MGRYVETESKRSRMANGEDLTRDYRIWANRTTKSIIERQRELQLVVILTLPFLGETYHDRDFLQSAGRTRWTLRDLSQRSLVFSLSHENKSYR